MATFIGSKVYAMSDDGNYEGVVTIHTAETFEGHLMHSKTNTGEEVNTEAPMYVIWEDDGRATWITGYNWSFVPADEVQPDEYVTA